jgi:polyphosphate kinase
LATGNYNPSTAKLYTDLSLFTCRPELGEEVTNLFNLLTGICQYQDLKRLWVAPFDLQRRLLERIEREAQHAERGLPARIIAKVNSLADERVIQALYRASQAGVQIDLIVRGICCLRPGVRRLSERIAVRSIVDRFLEHSRIFYFENACQPEVFVGSADWLPRNFCRRIELVFPIEDGNLRDRLTREILTRHLADNTKARCLQRDGSYVRAPRPEVGPNRRSQAEFMALAKAEPLAAPGPADGKPKYPKVRLARSPFTVGPRQP